MIKRTLTQIISILQSAVQPANATVSRHTRQAQSGPVGSPGIVPQPPSPPHLTYVRSGKENL